MVSLLELETVLFLPGLGQISWSSVYTVGNLFLVSPVETTQIIKIQRHEVAQTQFILARDNYIFYLKYSRDSELPNCSVNQI